MRTAEVSLVRTLPLFADIEEAHFDDLTATALLQRFPSHVELIREGELPDFLHIVVEGNVELFATHNGRETTLNVIGPVTTFILAAVIRDEVYLKSARSLTETQILMLPAEKVREVFSQDAAFARAVVGELAARYRDMARALKNEKLRTGVERLANWILAADRMQGDNGHVSISCDKRTLASLLGMTPEHLSRNLASIAEYGVKSSGRDITIADREALIAFAKPTMLIDD